MTLAIVVGNSFMIRHFANVKRIDPNFDSFASQGHSPLSILTSIRGALSPRPECIGPAPSPRDHRRLNTSSMLKTYSAALISKFGKISRNFFVFCPILAPFSKCYPP